MKLKQERKKTETFKRNRNLSYLNKVKFKDNKKKENWFKQKYDNYNWTSSSKKSRTFLSY